MFMRVMKFWFTGKDNESYEIIRALTALGAVMMIIYTGIHLFMNHQFDAVSMGTGLGGLLLGGGLGTAAKDGTFGKTGKSTTVENIEKVEVK